MVKSSGKGSAIVANSQQHGMICERIREALELASKKHERMANSLCARTIGQCYPQGGQRQEERQKTEQRESVVPVSLNAIWKE